MAYVITDACIKDFVCAAECATAAIMPASAGDPAAAGVSQLFINPDECIDCGNCASICAQNAIFSIDDLPAGQSAFRREEQSLFQLEVIS